jgi:RHS repeat-associated protein
VAFADGRTQLNAYGWADPTGATGRLLFSEHSHQGQTRYVYLGGKLIAEHNAQAGVRFAHTDALGSPVAWTSPNGSMLAIVTRYEPYGATAEGPQPASIGFTGHVNDGQTGLVYMQQRYYDPVSGRFLSVDPVATDADGGGHFNRYAYAESNPYKFVDPDGRAAECTGTRVPSGCGLVYNTVGTYVRPAHDTVEGQVQGAQQAYANNGKLDVPTSSAASAANALGLASGPGVVRLGVAKGLAGEASVLQKALSQAKPTGGHPQQVMTTLEDGSRVLFRKEFGSRAHALEGPLKGAGKIDHYNVELQSASGKTLQNLHIVPDGRGGFVWWGKDGVVKP